jgi:hypothetical protein
MKAKQGVGVEVVGRVQVGSNAFGWDLYTEVYSLVGLGLFATTLLFWRKARL